MFRSRKSCCCNGTDPTCPTYPYSCASTTDTTIVTPTAWTDSLGGLQTGQYKLALSGITLPSTITSTHDVRRIWTPGSEADPTTPPAAAIVNNFYANNKIYMASPSNRKTWKTGGSIPSEIYLKALGGFIGSQTNGFSDWYNTTGFGIPLYNYIPYVIVKNRNGNKSLNLSAKYSGEPYSSPVDWLAYASCWDNFFGGAVSKQRRQTYMGNLTPLMSSDMFPYAYPYADGTLEPFLLKCYTIFSCGLTGGPAGGFGPSTTMPRRIRFTAATECTAFYDNDIYTDGIGHVPSQSNVSGCEGQKEAVYVRWTWLDLQCDVDALGYTPSTKIIFPCSRASGSWHFTNTGTAGTTPEDVGTAAGVRYQYLVGEGGSATITGVPAKKWLEDAPKTYRVRFTLGRPTRRTGPSTYAQPADGDDGYSLPEDIDVTMTRYTQFYNQGQGYGYGYIGDYGTAHGAWYGISDDGLYVARLFYVLDYSMLTVMRREPYENAADSTYPAPRILRFYCRHPEATHITEPPENRPDNGGPTPWRLGNYGFSDGGNSGGEGGAFSGNIADAFCLGGYTDDGSPPAEDATGFKHTPLVLEKGDERQSNPDWVYVANEAQQRATAYILAVDKLRNKCALFPAAVTREEIDDFDDELVYAFYLRREIRVCGNDNFYVWYGRSSDNFPGWTNNDILHDSGGIQLELHDFRDDGASLKPHWVVFGVLACPLTLFRFECPQVQTFGVPLPPTEEYWCREGKLQEDGTCVGCNHTYLCVECMACKPGTCTGYYDWYTNVYVQLPPTPTTDPDDEEEAPPVQMTAFYKQDIGTGKCVWQSGSGDIRIEIANHDPNDPSTEPSSEDSTAEYAFWLTIKEGGTIKYVGQATCQRMARVYSLSFEGVPGPESAPYEWYDYAYDGTGIFSVFTSGGPEAPVNECTPPDGELSSASSNSSSSSSNSSSSSESHSSQSLSSQSETSVSSAGDGSDSNGGGGPGDESSQSDVTSVSSASSFSSASSASSVDVPSESSVSDPSDGQSDQSSASSHSSASNYSSSSSSEPGCVIIDGDCGTAPWNEDGQLSMGDSELTTRCKIFARTCIDVGEGNSGYLDDGTNYYAWAVGTGAPQFTSTLYDNATCGCPDPRMIVITMIPYPETSSASSASSASSNSSSSSSASSASSNSSSSSSKSSASSASSASSNSSSSYSSASSASSASSKSSSSSSSKSSASSASSNSSSSSSEPEAYAEYWVQSPCGSYPRITIVETSPGTYEGSDGSTQAYVYQYGGTWYLSYANYDTYDPYIEGQLVGVSGPAGVYGITYAEAYSCSVPSTLTVSCAIDSSSQSSMSSVSSIPDDLTLVMFNTGEIQDTASPCNLDRYWTRSGVPARVMTGHPAWLADASDRHYIGDVCDGQTTPPNEYATEWYATPVYLGTLVPFTSGTSINFRSSVDNSVNAVRVNGVTVTGLSFSGFSSWFNGSIPGTYLQAGSNLIEFQVANGGGPGGFMLEWQPATLAADNSSSSSSSSSSGPHGCVMTGTCFGGVFDEGWELGVGDSTTTTRCGIYRDTCVDIGNGESGTFYDPTGYRYAWANLGPSPIGSNAPGDCGCGGDPDNYLSITRIAA